MQHQLLRFGIPKHTIFQSLYLDTGQFVDAFLDFAKRALTDGLADNVVRHALVLVLLFLQCSRLSSGLLSGSSSSGS
jgi:hypothetical protein